MVNPISFRPGPVTFWTSLVYLALLIPIVIINEVVPPVPSQFPSVDLTEAWLDLDYLTKAYHPYNSRYNDDIRAWLLQRTHEILDSNSVSWATEYLGAGPSARKDTDIVIFDDVVSNSTFLFAGSGGTNAQRVSKGGQAAYFEGNNIYVYIKGTEDHELSWSETKKADATKYSGNGLTLVNAHFDSVSTGFGATDDGMGVVSVLQLIRHFSIPSNRPKRGIVALFNNGEEDFLYGARIFGRSPLLPYIHTFLNLEGAGAGGRALLFRTTDQEVTAAYAGTSDPFGTVLASDAFGLGFVHSQTDYVVLNGIFGQRGLDLAFYKPRSRYHTNHDDASHTSRSSLWHMLSAAIHTTENLSNNGGDAFSGPRPDGARDKVDNGTPSDGVWFDLFGKGFVLFNLRGMFAWSLTVLIVTPLILLLVTYLLHNFDKYYFFTAKVRTYEQPDYEPVLVGGWKGFFRFPFALGIALALSLGAVFLLRKVNPLILNSSRYTVLAMFFSLLYFSFWAVMRGANFVRPSALHRGYANIWLFVIGWAILVAVTVFEDRFRIAAGYMFVFLQSAVFLSTLISLLELFALPKMTAWGQEVREDHEARDNLLSGHHTDGLISPTPGEAVSPLPRDEIQEDEEDLPNESTPLVGGNHTADSNRVTFATTYRRSISAVVAAARKASVEKGDAPFDDEQPWSSQLPSWTWWFQFLLLGPIVIILSAQAGLMILDSVNQTGYDGSDVLFPYILTLLFTALTFLPLTPFIHRVTYHVPVFLLAVFVGTLIYNLAAFPYSNEARLVTFFQQKLDLDTGTTVNHFSGLEKYVRAFVADMPSAAGQVLDCAPNSVYPQRTSCSYDGSLVKPNLGAAPEQLISLNLTRGSGNKATLKLDAVNTKLCFLEFARPVSGLIVHGSSDWDDRFGTYPDDGIGLVKLWRRNWVTPWVVDFEWADPPISSDATSTLSSSFGGRVICQWSDANTQGTIPALEEAIKFAPTWSAVTKTAEGLVEVTKKFKID